jgi:predicted aldo/keto reductase-like oxidoreductase
MKTAGAAGLTPVLAAMSSGDPKDTKIAKPEDSKSKTEKVENPQVPKRKLGKTGVEVPCLAMGGIFDITENQIILRKSREWGVTYWDTADCYEGGNSELGIGQYFEKNPKAREQIFLVSKSDERDPKGMQKLLDRSLKRMKTDYINLYFIHGLEEPEEEMTADVKAWVEKTKKEGKIRLFGFSTHENMPNCLQAAAKASWIDAIMTTYNFRVMQDKKMQAAVEACHKAGIGLVAMKTQAEEQQRMSKKEKGLIERFIKRGFTEHQAKLKAVWQDERFAAVCSQMDKLNILLSNIAAALDKTKLTKADMDYLKEYAAATCSGYCAGCGHICGSAVPQAPYVSKLMRYLMYYNSYGDHERARQYFAQIPAGVRKRLARADYSLAEARCPQNLPIAKFVAEAVTKLA